MRRPTDLAAWIRRGEELGLFNNVFGQMRYLEAWDGGAVDIVAAELERIFVTRYQMLGINWLALPTLLEQLDALEDRPAWTVEDWEDADFSFRAADGVLYGPEALLQSGAWDRLLATAARVFLGLGRAEKVRLAARWSADARRLVWMRPASVAELVEAAVGTRLLECAAPASAVLRAVCDVPMGLSAILQGRVETLVGAWRVVLGPSSDRRPLTLTRLRGARLVFELDALLADVEVPATVNLISYLRCADLPASTSP